MATASEFLGKLYLATEDRPADARDLPYILWGFTIYRTAYGTISDQRWHSLLETIQSQAKMHTMHHLGLDENDADFQRVWYLFRLDARSDEKLLSGLNMDQARDIYNGGDGSPPMNRTDSLRRVFLVADDEVLSDAGTAIIKAVSADYTPVPYNPMSNSRGLRQRYFGWMKINTGSIVDLWRSLEFQEFEGIAPPTIGGSHLVIWKGVGY